MKKFLLLIMIVFVCHIFQKKHVFGNTVKSYEIHSYRGINSKVFANTQGNYEIHFYSNPIHRLVNGRYEELNDVIIFKDKVSTIFNGDYVIYIEKKQNTIFYTLEYKNKYSISIKQSINASDHKSINNLNYQSLNDLSIFSDYLNDLNANNYSFKPYLSTSSTFEFDFSENLILSKGTNVLTDDLKDFPVFQFNNDSDYVVFDNELDIDTISSNFQIIFSQNTISSVLKDKTIINQSSTILQSNTVRVGRGTLNIDDISYYFDFKGVYELRLPNFINSNIISAQMEITSTSNLISTPLLYSIDTIDYDEIDGNTQYEISSSISSTKNGQQLKFDILDSINTSLANSDNRIVYVLCPRKSFDYEKEFYSTKSSINSPKIILEFDNLPFSDYGNAPDYGQGVSNINTMNCYGYAMLLNQNLIPYLLPNYNSSSSFFDNYSSILLSDIGNHYSVRIISNIEEPILFYERRIAFRIAYDELSGYTLDFHFIRQDFNGYWSQKSGSMSSNLIASVLITNQHWGGYNSETIYFAVSTI